EMDKQSSQSEVSPAVLDTSSKSASSVSTSSIVTKSAFTSTSNSPIGDTTSFTIFVEETARTLPEDVIISCGNSTKSDIIFLLDASSSIGASNWLKQVQFASKLVQNFSVGPNANQFGAVIFNSHPTKIFDLNAYSNETGVANALLSIQYPFTSGTYTDVALSFVRTNDLFGTAQGGRDEAQNILLVITDGQSYFPTLTISEAQKLKDAGVSIVTIGIGLTVYGEINAMASQLDYVFTINSFDLLDNIQNSLLNTTCD
ncbi:serine-rich adhesin for platelets, partial [Biomphalaria pfeifferi]